MSTAVAPCPGCEDERTDVFTVEGLCCATEVALVETGLARTPGVCSVRASAVTGKATVVHTGDPAAVERAIAALGFRARSESAASGPAAPAVKPVVPAAALVFTLAGAVAGFYASAAAVPLYAAAILVGGVPIARTGWRRLRQGTDRKSVV